MSDKETSGKERGMQYVMMVVSVCMLDIVCVYLMKRDSSLPAYSWPSACIYPSS